MERTKPASVSAYMAGFPPDAKKILEQIRSLIRETVPEAEESISYDIPTYKVNGKPVIYFAGFRNHVSVYPAPRGVAPFDKELAAYKGGKGTVQFPLTGSLPEALIKKIVAFRLQEVKVPKKSAPKSQI